MLVSNSGYFDGLEIHVSMELAGSIPATSVKEELDGDCGCKWKRFL